MISATQLARHRLWWDYRRCYSCFDGNQRYSTPFLCDGCCEPETAVTVGDPMMLYALATRNRTWWQRIWCPVWAWLVGAW